MGKKKVVEAVKKQVEANPVFVVETKDPNAINVVLEKIKLTKDHGFNLDELYQWLSNNFQHPDNKLWLGFDGEEIRGVMLVSKVYPVILPEAFIDFTWVDPKYKEVGQQLLNAVEQWMKKEGLKKLSAIVRRGMNALCEKYGFSVDSYNISKIVT